MKISIGADHGGYDLKEHVKGILAARGIPVEDVGCYDKKSTDYPDYARTVALHVQQGTADQGILICTTGIGMSIAANKFPGIRAALCLTPYMAEMARSHNNANILVMGANVINKSESEAILDKWLRTAFEPETRHERRLKKLYAYGCSSADTFDIYGEDKKIYASLEAEIKRQQSTINLIASENYASRAVREAQGSVMTDKYAEGYPAKRWYYGCEHVDEVERLAIDRAKKLFGAEHVNVQPHSGSQANMAVYFAMLKPGDTILAMRLAHGGHLTHGHEVNFSGRLFKIEAYGVSRTTEQIDYDEVAALAERCKPKLIVAGASAYSRIINFERFRRIADNVGAFLMADMAHIAGLVAAGCHPSPIPHADFVTTTTHKTLRGPRGGMILCKNRFAKDIDREIFPGIQGGPLMHVIAAKAVCLHEALQPSFKEYQKQVVRNAQTLAASLASNGLRIVSGGTDNHMILVDMTGLNLSGKDAASALCKAGITVNKNSIPFDMQSPAIASGIRIGTPAVTTRGMKEAEMKTIGQLIVSILRDGGNESVQEKARQGASDLAARFPILMQ